MTAAAVVDILHHITRANYEQAAVIGPGDGDTFEVVADAVAIAVPAGWARHVSISELSHTIATSLLQSANELAGDSPARHAIRLVHQQIRSLASRDHLPMPA